MKALVKRAKDFLVSEDGPTATEYAVMLALIIVVALGAISVLGTKVSTVFNNVKTSITNQGYDDDQSKHHSILSRRRSYFLPFSSLGVSRAPGMGHNVGGCRVLDRREILSRGGRSSGSRRKSASELGPVEA